MNLAVLDDPDLQLATQSLLGLSDAPSFPETLVLRTVDREEVAELSGDVSTIVNTQKVNDIRYLNKFFEAVNEKLPEGGHFVGVAETSQQRKRRLLDKYPGLLGRLYYQADFVFKRVFPKLRITRGLYFALTHGRNRVLSEAEILGRLCSCGFEIEEASEIDGRLWFTVRKVRAPYYDENPSYGPVFRMRRIGRNGEAIYVYKLRTMHPYAEYLQQYVYRTRELQKTGKFDNDFRVTTWGRYFRRVWIDELPMLINWLRGDLKLVGVRPLSEHYLTLYPADFAERRSRHTPGLIPPFYADLPRGFEEILRSEAEYLEAYEANPRMTDVRYFCRAFVNIVFRHARSQ